MSHATIVTAFRLARQGERSRAYQLFAHVLRTTPTDVPAWLGLSTVVTDPVQQRECLERALALDPACQVAQTRLAQLRPASAPALAAACDHPQSIGAYLVTYGALTPSQLADALAAQSAQRAATQPAPPLGHILIARGWVQPSVLATLLVLQLQDQVLGPQARPPQRLGELLVVAGLMPPEQLAAPLAEQMRRQLHGRSLPLGRLLIQRRLLTEAQLAQVLTVQQAQRRERAQAAATASGSRSGAR
jgi:hypothetical protein